MLRSLLVVGLMLSLLTPPGQAQEADSEPVAVPGQVVLDRKGAFTLGGPNSQVQAERSAWVQARLNQALAQPKEPTVRTGKTSQGWVLLVNESLVVTITDADTKFHNTSAPALVQEWAKRLQDLLQDSSTLTKHRNFNIKPETVTLRAYGYQRTERRINEVPANLITTGQTSFRNQLFTASSDPVPKEIYLRDADGSWVVYEQLLAPQQVAPTP